MSTSQPSDSLDAPKAMPNGRADRASDTEKERAAGSWGKRLSHAFRFLDHPKVSRLLAGLLTVLSLAAGLSTYWAFSGRGANLAQDPEHLVGLIYLDLVLLLLLSVIIVRRLVRLWSERKRGAAGAHMHVRLAAMFGIFAIAPAIIVAGFSLLFFNFGLESWFSERVRTAVSESSAVAQAYLDEHLRTIEADALWIASALNRDAAVLTANQQLLNRLLNFQVGTRNLSEVLVFEENGRILARAGLTIALEFEPIPTSAFEDARDGSVVILRNEADDRVRALVRLDTIIDTFLIVGRAIDPTVLAHVAATQGATKQFVQLEKERSRFQVSFALSFVLVAMLLLLTAVWVGLNVANGLSEPISRLIAATERVRAGDLSVQVSPSSKNDEVDVLGRAFNRMTEQLQSQRNELLQANMQVDERRRFIETVLTGVSAGVVGLDRHGQIELANRRASELLGAELDQFIGHDMAEIVPDMTQIIDEVLSNPETDFVEKEIKVEGGGMTRSLIVRSGPLTQGDGAAGYVMTLDDITALASAQRTAAWADVARRIAHEIKNPLTPIQLSAERLKRKYLKGITNDPHVFETCVDTIIRQVGDIGRMVDEFSNFARMPAPTMQDVDLSDLCRQQVFLQRNANPAIEYTLTMPEDPVHITADGRQIAQVLTNVLQNAKEAIDSRPGTDLPGGRIALSLVTTVAAQTGAGREAGREVRIEVVDNGKGLPSDDRDRLTEPYVTFREKGTGLGLAIVKKIMDDHRGSLTLTDAPPDFADGAGAQVILGFHGRTLTDTGMKTETNAIPGPDAGASSRKGSN
ncbi:ATP-binding protein [Hwanghaeella sp.]|uniref:sensor histidine kinase NtrY-like n=1 Tax=Hwanghaeella sp. TaxID=2605943 RepID=UPI003CCBB793